MTKWPINEALGYALKQAQHTLRRKMDEKLQPLGLSSSQYAVLRAIKDEPNASNAELARLCFITPQSMHGIVSALETQDLITRRPDADHRRKQLVQLTKTGAKQVALANEIIAEIEDLLADAVAPLEPQVVLAILHRCRDRLEAS